MFVRTQSPKQSVLQSNVHLLQGMLFGAGALCPSLREAHVASVNELPSQKIKTSCGSLFESRDLTGCP
jgi:hypothetical protein